MNLSAVFVGTAGSTPTARRGLASLLLRRGGDQLLFDCGEGTQRQLIQSVGLGDIEHLFLTHFHADHILGIPGMLKTFGLRGREVPMTIYGPPGLQEVIDDMDTLIGRLPFDVDIYELEPGEQLGFKGYSVSGFDVDHRGRAFGFKLSEIDRPGHFDESAARRLGVPPGPDFGVLQRGGEITVAGGKIVKAEQVVGEQRRGRTIVYSGDTAPCEATVDAARGADLLVHESTFGDEEVARARETSHSTARQAAEVARDAGVEMLCLTHVSGRYFGKELRAEAREVFANTELPRDFDVVELPFPERGTPILVKHE
ncbi:MAG: ribonuclease Z [Thermoleophilaceae bacterium]|nr:ribonuclease Z [Thermoleophilaceae bacterium]